MGSQCWPLTPGANIERRPAGPSDQAAAGAALIEPSLEDVQLMPKPVSRALVPGRLTSGTRTGVTPQVDRDVCVMGRTFAPGWESSVADGSQTYSRSDSTACQWCDRSYIASRLRLENAIPRDPACLPAGWLCRSEWESRHAKARCCGSGNTRILSTGRTGHA